MKYLIIISMCLSLNISSLAAESSEIINTDKVNQLLDVENFKKSDKEQELLNLYKERLNLLSYKERQLKVYENSLKGLKSEIDLIQVDLENKQNALNEKEIALLKKELQLKEKERDLNQLEEKLAQIDNVQLIRTNNKPSTPSVTLNSELKIDEVYSDKSNDKNLKLKAESIDTVLNVNAVKETPKRKYTYTPTKKDKVKKTLNTTSVVSGLGQMKKDILTDNSFKEK